VPYRRRYDIETELFESVWLEIIYPNCKPFLLNFIYRPLNVHQSWTDDYEKQLSIINILNIEYHILGYVNINFYPMNKKKKYNNTKWGDLIRKYGLKQSQILLG
jgi:hypothetical protein